MCRRYSLYVKCMYTSILAAHSLWHFSSFGSWADTKILSTMHFLKLQKSLLTPLFLPEYVLNNIHWIGCNWMPSKFTDKFHSLSWRDADHLETTPLLDRKSKFFIWRLFCVFTALSHSHSFTHSIPPPIICWYLRLCFSIINDKYV